MQTEILKARKLELEAQVKNLELEIEEQTRQDKLAQGKAYICTTCHRFQEKWESKAHQYGTLCWNCFQSKTQYENQQKLAAIFNGMNFLKADYDGNLLTGLIFENKGQQFKISVGSYCGESSSDHFLDIEQLTATITTRPGVSE